jgi:hypothetical protein
MSRWALTGLLILAFAASLAAGFLLWSGDSDGGDSVEATESHLVYEIERDPDVPDLPFDDNPDPSQCGIPVQWGQANNQAWLSGIWEDELIQPEVLLYESHLRTSVVGGSPHGTEVRIVLFQENPILDYYYVQIRTEETSSAGWVPEHFLSFDPVA